MKTLIQSETKTIKRSQISLNPINPKRHTEERVKLQKKNLQKVGFLGGIVWNELSGNLIDGHRRVMAMDLYYKYDRTAAIDYEIKVEAVKMDDKTEKEQLTYMAIGNTKADIDLIADYIQEIDYSDFGLSDAEIADITSLSVTDLPIFEPIEEDLTDFIKEKEREVLDNLQNYEDRIQHMKDVKRQVNENAIEREQNEHAYIMLSFSSYQTKEDFCDLLGISTDEKFAKGEDVIKMIG